MRQSKYAALAVPASGNMGVSGLAQPCLGIQAVLQQVAKTEARTVAVQPVPAVVQGGNGKTRLPQSVDQGAILKGRQHGAGIKQHDPGPVIGPEFEPQFPVMGRQLVRDKGWFVHGGMRT